MKTITINSEVELLEKTSQKPFKPKKVAEIIFQAFLMYTF